MGFMQGGCVVLLGERLRIPGRMGFVQKLPQRIPSSMGFVQKGCFVLPSERERIPGRMGFMQREPFEIPWSMGFMRNGIHGQSLVIEV